MPLSSFIKIIVTVATLIQYYVGAVVGTTSINKETYLSDDIPAKLLQPLDYKHLFKRYSDRMCHRLPRLRIFVIFLSYLRGLPG